MLYNRLKLLYDEGKLTIRQLENAVAKNWITEEQKQIIIGGE